MATFLYILMALCTAATASKTATSPLPNTFSYTCTSNGGIMIRKDASLANTTLIKTAGDCAAPTTNDTYFMLDNCGMNKTVTIVMERIMPSDSDVIGGKDSKLFQVMCNKVKITPYLQTATVSNVTINDHSAPIVVTMATTIVTPLQLTMTITFGSSNTTVTNAVIGQELKISISKPGSGKIKPTVCIASGIGTTVTLWDENGCKHNDELFGPTWTNDTTAVSNILYGFRFVGSNDISIMCTVRVCPTGYSGTDCDLASCTVPIKKRKRINRKSGDPITEVSETSLTITDITPTSSAAKPEFGVSRVVGLFVAAVVLVNARRIQS